MADDSGTDACYPASTYNGSFGLRVGGLFVVLVTSLAGALTPALTRRIKCFQVPMLVWDFFKYFGAGVIIATAFIHLLSPATEELGNPCLTGAWTLYPWAIAIAMMSVFGIFLTELVAHRAGIQWLSQLGIDIPDTHGPGIAHGPEHPGNHAERDHHAEDGHRRGKLLHFDPSTPLTKGTMDANSIRSDLENATLASRDSHEYGAQILGVAILEFGIVVHSVIIGMTLAVTDEFVTLFVVIIFHQMFEGLGLGTRLAALPLPSRLNWVPIVGAIMYAICTPMGMGIGLGLRETYSPDTITASIVSGIIDSISAGILLYTGLVELLAHDFLFNEKMRKASNTYVAFAVISVMTGTGIMALLGRWA